MIAAVELFVSRVVVMIVDNFGIRMQLNSRMQQLEMMRERVGRHIHKKRLVFCLLVLEKGIRAQLSDCVARIELQL